MCLSKSSCPHLIFFSILCFFFFGSLRTFAAEWRQAQKEKEEQKRRKLVRERAVLVKHGQMTPKLRSVLASIFVKSSCRSAGDAESTASTTSSEVYLRYTEAARLWYRCGLKLSCLHTLLQSKPENVKRVYMQDFFAIIERVLEEDERVANFSPVERIEPLFRVRRRSTRVRVLRMRFFVKDTIQSNAVNFHLCRSRSRSPGGRQG